MSAGGARGAGDLMPTLEALARDLRRRGQRMATAESCTGGMIAAMLTDLPGSSEYFLGGVVSYANDAKEGFLGVDPETIRRCGAVSPETALAMARGALDRFGADVAVSVTGIAGPDGGTPEKPVGTVHFGLAASGGAAVTKKRLFGGDRAVVRRASAVQALELLRRFLAGEES
jgi:PncC family amidohydrolase